MKKKIKQLGIISATDHNPPISITLRRKSAAKFHGVQSPAGMGPRGAGWSRIPRQAENGSGQPVSLPSLPSCCPCRCS